VPWRELTFNTCPPPHAFYPLFSIRFVLLGKRGVFSGEIMNLPLCIVATTAVLIGYVASAFALDDSEAAYAVCRKMEKLGVPSEDCEVDEWSQSVTVSIESTHPEARKLCFEITQRFAGTHRFERSWTLAIKSPSAGDFALATCDFIDWHVHSNG